MLKSVLFLCFVVLAVAEEQSRSQCKAKHNVEKDDWKKLNADPFTPAEKMLCYFRCFYEETGTVNSEGKLDVEKLIENTNEWKPLSDASKISIRKCVEDLGPVKTCAEVNPSFQCVQKALDKQNRGNA